MANAKPTILIVPGSFSFGKFYDGIIDRLTNAGYTAFASDLPSASRRTPQQPATLADDAAHFHGLAEKLVEAGKEVVLFAHSYGGNPASECAKGLWMEERKKQGKKGGIVRIVYLASPVVKEGEALTDVMGAINVPFIKVDGDFMYMDPVEGCAETTFSDVDRAQGIELAKQFGHHSIASFASKLTYAAYKTIPVSYIFCEEDQTVPRKCSRRSSI
ncbi:hypothetical protein H2203_000734 [Taxawa tesnikishii (nom. ined.)]|nr:hypothetical protein H2203_000734 [Dothideales sp. JES 119]